MQRPEGVVQLLTTTATVPVTEGNKLRHFDNAMDMTFGPLNLFLTCNFADTYMPLTMIIFGEDGAAVLHSVQPLGRAA